MKNRFNLNEEEKNHIRGLHNISEQSGFVDSQGGSDSLSKFNKRQEVGEDAGMDTPGGNPDYFYDEDSILSKLKNQRDQEVEMSKDDIISTVVEIYSLLQDDAPAIATRRIEELLYKLGHFKN